MKRISTLAAAAALTLAACTNNPIAVSSQTILDTQLASVGLRTIVAVLSSTNKAPAADIVIANAALSALNDALTQARSGTLTDASLAEIARDRVTTLAPILLSDFNANATITEGVTDLVNLLPLILAEAGLKAPTTAAAPLNARADVRKTMMVFVAKHPAR